MGRTIDWYYHRKGDATCIKADAYLLKRGATAREQVDARKVKVGKPQIAQILRGTHLVLAVKGSALVEFNLRQDPPVEKLLYENLIGPTGSLRTPAIRVGKTLVVGFSEASWGRALG